MTDKQAKATTREQALRVARMLGCQGAHEQGDGWMPCGSPEEYVAIKKGEEEYLKVRASLKKKPQPTIVQRTKRLETKSDAYYENRADALAVSRARGCNGVRTVILAGKKYYAVCEPKKPKNGWENLTEKPITGIATLPGGGIVTGSFSGKSLGRPIGGVAEFDSDGDGNVTGPDGKDNVPALKNIESLIQRDGSVLKFFRSPNPNSDASERIHVLDDKGNVVREMWVMKNSPEWNERKPIKSADSILDNLDNLEKDFSKKYGDIRDPENMSKAVRSVFPNLYKDLDMASLYPLRNEDGSVRDVDVSRVVVLLKGGLQDPETARRIDVISVDGKMTGGLFGGNLPGVFVYGASDNPDKTFFAGLDFSPDKEPTFIKTHGWGLKVLTEMRDGGYSKKDIDSFYGAYLASHEFGHAKHLLRALEKDGINVDAKSEKDLIGNIRALLAGRDYQRLESDEDIELAIRSELLIRGDYEKYKDKNDAERRRLALMAIMNEAEGFYFRTFKEKDALWDDLSDSERADILQREEWQKVSGYAAENALEFVAETISQGLMGHKEGHTPKHWAKMAEWMKTKSAKVKDGLIQKSVTDIYPEVTGKVTAMCDGFIGAESANDVDSEKSLEEKGFVNFASRSTDPDVFSNAESARIRARNLGCIGIRRYTAGDGKTVWLPCTNVSDFNRLSGIRGDNSPVDNSRRRGSANRKKSSFDNGLISFKGVPKAKKKPPTLTSDDINNLAVRVRQHNAKSTTESKTNLRDLKIIYIRGLLDDGRKEADKRVSKFLSLLNSEKPKDLKYSEDNDLLPLEHPWRNRKTSKKFAGFTEGEYGVKYSSGCCPDVVKRHRAK